MKHVYQSIDGRELHARVWGGSKAAMTVVAWHGVSRNGSDFDALAAALEGKYRIVCPDAPGRGMSEWADDPAEYSISAMATRAGEMLRALRIGRCVWIGTSMGGLVGMALANTAWGSRLRGLVVNDIAPVVPEDAAAYVREYLAEKKSFGTLAEAERYFRETYAPFGRMTDAEWRSLTVSSVARMPDGKWTTGYDPRVARSIAEASDEDAAWTAFSRIGCPVLVLRGESSTLLSPDAAKRMADSHPECSLMTFEGCGHAPMLNTPKQIRAVARFVDKCAR